MDPSLLPSLAWFAHIAQHRSFTKAAAQMGVSRAALSQNLKALEKQLNVKLLYRTTRDMSLTEEGQRLLEALAPPSTRSNTPSARWKRAATSRRDCCG